MASKNQKIPEGFSFGEDAIEIPRVNKEFSLIKTLFDHNSGISISPKNPLSESFRELFSDKNSKVSPRGCRKLRFLDLKKEMTDKEIISHFRSCVKSDAAMFYFLMEKYKSETENFFLKGWNIFYFCLKDKIWTISVHLAADGGWSLQCHSIEDPNPWFPETRIFVPDPVKFQ